MNEEEKAIIEEKLIECYKLKGITFDDESLYKEENKIKKFKESQDMPTTDVSEDPFKDFGEEIALSDDDLPF